MWKYIKTLWKCYLLILILAEFMENSQWVLNTVRYLCSCVCWITLRISCFLFLCPDAWARLQCVKAASIACINVWTNVVCICHVHSLDWDETSVRSDNFFHVPIVHFNSSVIRKLMLNIILIWSSSMHPSLSNGYNWPFLDIKFNRWWNW